MVGIIGLTMLALVAYEAETGELSAKYQANVKPAIEKHLDAEYNEETGLTDFRVGSKEFSLEVEHDYDFND